MTAPKTVKVAGIKVQGKSLAGTFPVVRIDDIHVVVRHPQYGAIKVPRANTDIAAAHAVTLSYDQLVVEIDSRFDILDRLMDGIVDGHTRSFIVSGPPGVGKTFGVNSKLAAGTESGKVKSVLVIKGVVSPISLYMLMYENRRKGQVILIDDSDRIFFDEVGANLIKAATDSGKKRFVSYFKEAAVLDANGIPKSFEYNGSIVVATNLDFEKEISAQTKAGVHLGAIMNRSLYLDLGLKSKQALMARVEQVCRKTTMLKEAGLNAEQIDEVIGWMKDNQSTVRSLSLRTAEQLASMIATDPTGWKQMARVTMLKAIVR